MKTNQSMMVRIGDYTQPIEHLTMMGHLNSLWDYVNGLRAARGLPPKGLDNWVRASQTRELILAIEKRYYVNFTEYEILENGTTKYLSPLNTVKTKTGKGGGTWVHLCLLLDAAAWLDAEFKVEMYETFINNKILHWRDESGDQYNNLTAHIDAYLPGREFKLDNKGIIINCAKMIRAAVKPDCEVGWNGASYQQLEHRVNIETKLCEFLRMGLVRDWDHLKELIAKL
jgi:hypothetical protein